MAARYDIHPIAGMFPAMSPEEYTQLCEDVKRNGLQKKIVIHEGKILDGRHRYQACLETKTTPLFEAYRGKDPLGYAISANLRRRNLDQSQRAICAAKIKSFFEEAAQERMKLGKSPDPKDNLPYGQVRDQAGALMGVSGKSVDRAAKVIEDGAASIVKAVEDGEVSISDAAKIVDLPKQEQQEALKAVRKGEAKTLREAVAQDLAKEEEPEDQTIDEIIAEKNSALESFCRKLMKLVEDELPQDKWLDHLNRRTSALQKFKDGCTTVRSAKCHCACPKCDGNGCTVCYKTGRITKALLDQIA